MGVILGVVIFGVVCALAGYVAGVLRSSATVSSAVEGLGRYTPREVLGEPWGSTSVYSDEEWTAKTIAATKLADEREAAWVAAHPAKVRVKGGRFVVPSSRPS